MLTTISNYNGVIPILPLYLRTWEYDALPEHCISTAYQLTQHVFSTCLLVTLGTSNTHHHSATCRRGTVRLGYCWFPGTEHRDCKDRENLGTERHRMNVRAVDKRASLCFRYCGYFWKAEKLLDRSNPPVGFISERPTLGWVSRWPGGLWSNWPG